MTTFESHLDNLETLRIDCSKAQFPAITVGMGIKEVVIIGYPDETLSFSKVMRNEDGSVGFPNLKLFQLINPDYIKSSKEFIVDVLLDVFSNRAVFIVDKEIITIYEYYTKYYTDPAPQFLVETKKVVEDTIKGMLRYEENKVEEQYLSFEEWYSTLVKEKINSSYDEEFLAMVKSELENPKKTQTFYSADEDPASSAVNEPSEVDKYYNDKSETKEFKYSETDKQLIVAVAEDSPDKLYEWLDQKVKGEFVNDVYKSAMQTIAAQNITSEEDIIKTKDICLLQIRKAIIDEFSNKWFVSKGELELSAIQYQSGMNSIPNIRKIIESKDFKRYRLKNPTAKSFKYAQEMKEDWKKVLDEKIAPLSKELSKEVFYD